MLHTRITRALLLLAVVLTMGCVSSPPKRQDDFVKFVPAEFMLEDAGLRELPGLMNNRQFRIGLALYLMGADEEFLWTPNTILVRRDGDIAKDMEYRANITNKASAVDKSYQAAKKDWGWP